MQSCIVPLILVAIAIFVMVSLLRWFEQTTEAVEQRWWNKVTLLLVMPFAVWLYPSKVAAGRPTPVPRHEPVRGMGTAPKIKPEPTPGVPDVPPPGTPKEFLGKPVIPKPKPSKGAIDPEQVAKLREKMREQGMLDEES